MENGGDYSWTQIQKISDQPRQQQDEDEQDEREEIMTQGKSANRAPAESIARSHLDSKYAATNYEPFKCDGGNVMQLSTRADGAPCSSDDTTNDGTYAGIQSKSSVASSCTIADISRTGLEGLMGFSGPGTNTKHLSFTADNFIINLTITGAPSARARAASWP